MLEVKDKKIAVIGLSRTGVASARMLVKWGADVVVSDIKTAEKLHEELDKLGNIDIEYELGGHGEKCLNSDMIVVSPGVPLDIPFFHMAEEKGIPIISEIELAYHFTEANIIAITGTNGKTTTTSLIGEILQNTAIGEVRIAGNIGIPLVTEAVGLSSDDWLVVEISSFQLETIKDFRPDISIYLNFSPDHLDRHKTIENYWLAKKRIFENQTCDDYAVVNSDDENVIKAVAGFPGKIYNVSIEKDIVKLGQGVSVKDDQIIIYDQGKQIDIMDIADIPLKGKHNIQNVCFAILASYLAGSSIDVIKESIKGFKPSAHRLQTVYNLRDDILVVDDSKATNPDAAIKAVESFDRPIVLIAGGQDRNADFTQWSEIICKKVRILILLGETRFKMKEVALNQGFDNINIHIAEDMQDSVQAAVDYLQPGDCLLLSPACPSWDMYSSYKVRGQEFQDAVKELSNFES